MPQLETLGIGFHAPVSNRDVETQMLSSPMMQIILPNLRMLGFQGVSTYLEGILAHISAPQYL